MNNNVNHPKHYTSSDSGHECIEFAELLNFNRGNAFKYAWRAFDKHENCVEDLKKCAWYLRRELSRGNERSLDRPVKSDDMDILKHQNTGGLCFEIFIGQLDCALERVLGMIERETVAVVSSTIICPEKEDESWDRCNEAFLPDRQP